MYPLTKDSTPCRTNPELGSPRSCGARARSLLLLLLGGAMTLSSCGGGGYSRNGSTQFPANLSGNWQFTMAPPADGSFVGGLQGGFLLQSNTSVTGAAAYSISLPPIKNSILCNSGAAAITGTLTGQNVVLSAAAGSQTFSFTGTLSFDGSTIVGTYNSTAGTAADGTPCGTVQTGLQWNASFVPPLVGPIQGTFHSTGGPAGLNQQDFLVSGAISQGANTGATSSTVTGNLNFINAATSLSDYPCLAGANVTGQISGNSVSLQLTDANGSSIGQIGPSQPSATPAVTFNHTQNGYALQSLAGAGYAVYAAACGGGTLQSPADSGNICLAVNNTTACQQPITLAPSALTFPSRSLDSPSTTLPITLTNNTGASLGGLTITLVNKGGTANFAETDTCGLQGVASQGTPFDLLPLQSCVITIAFVPLQSCAAGTTASQCLTATLSVTSPNNDAIFTVPVTGGVGTGAASIREPVLGKKNFSESASLPLRNFPNEAETQSIVPKMTND
jgi:hypothetical protein